MREIELLSDSRYVVGGMTSTGWRDRARERLAELQEAAVPAVAISASGDWDRLTIDEKRALIRAVVDRADVRPGRGPDRISFKLRGE